MKQNLGKAAKAAGALFLALALAMGVFAPSMVSAQAADATSSATVAPSGGQAAPQSAGSMPSAGKSTGGAAVAAIDLTKLTAEQKAVYEKALALYNGIEDAVLADLVAAGLATQADVDAYTAARDGAAELAALDTSAWTAAQFKAYYEALQLNGDARKAALQALADAGQLTQGQAAALTGDDTIDLWKALRKNSRKDPAVKTALNTLKMAQQAFERTLRDAGIKVSKRGGAPSANNNRPPVTPSDDWDDDRDEDEGEGEDDD